MLSVLLTGKIETESNLFPCRDPDCLLRLPEDFLLEFKNVPLFGSQRQ